MKLNISFPATGCQKVIEIDDEIKLRHLYDKRMSHEIEGDILGDDFKVRRAQFDHDAVCDATKSLCVNAFAVRVSASPQI